MEIYRCKLKKKDMQANDSCRWWTLADNKYVVTAKTYMVCSTCTNWEKR